MIGQSILHYKIIEKLGEGGMGVVYRAQDTKLNREVALKFLPEEAMSSTEAHDRFFAEARAAAGLDHPNICTVFEINEDAGKAFIAMALIEGRSLKEEIDERAMKVERAIRLGAQIASGLAAAHEKGIVHRDIKSSNIMVTPKGQAKIMDFGLAHDTSTADIDEEGSTLGTAAYSSPEQTRGETLDHRTDIWSFGVTLYEMVTGKLPFRGDYSQAIVYSINNEQPEPPTAARTGLPAELEQIIMKALAKDAGDRYQSAEQMAADLVELRNRLDPATGTLTSSVRYEEPSFFKKLIDRHVLLAIGGYAAAAWGLVKLTEALVSQMAVSPYWVNLVTVGLVSLVPAVFAIAYFRGEPMGKKWARMALPVNLLATVAVLFAMFQGKELGAVTETRTIETEDGQSVTQVVPKSEFRKRLLINYFQPVNADTTWEWQAGALPTLVEFDLFQDRFLDINGYLDSNAFEAFKEAGYLNNADAPLPLTQKIAVQNYRSHFITGQLAKDGDSFTGTYQLYEADNGKKISEKSFSGTDIYAIADKMSVAIRRDTGVPEGFIQENKDLPVAELVTADLTALKALIDAGRSMLWEQDYVRAMKELNHAVDIDEKFAIAHFLRWNIARNLNQPEVSDQALRTAIKYKYRLPELISFAARANHYFENKQPDKAYRVLEMMTEIYPDDVTGYKFMMQINVIRRDFAGAIKAGEKVLQLDPNQFNYLHQVGGLYQQLGDSKKAEEYYQRYIDQRPTDTEGYNQMASFYESRGRFDEASSLYERSVLLEPDQPTVIADMGDVAGRVGKIDQALKSYQEALAAATTDEQRIAIYERVERYYMALGQVSTAIEKTELRLAMQKKMLPPLAYYIEENESNHRWVQAGRYQEALQRVKDSEPYITGPMAPLVNVGYLTVYLENEDAQQAEPALRELDDWVTELGIGVVKPMVHRGDGAVKELRGDYSGAVAAFREELRLSPASETAMRNVGRAERLAGNSKEAIKMLTKALEIQPYDAKTNYELALVYWEEGDRDEALEHIKRAMHMWEHADENYRWAKEARAKLAEWEPSL